MRRVASFVDGFNLYHSLRATETGHGTPPLRWLDLQALCRNFAPLVAPDAIMVSIDYFTAIPYPLAGSDPGKLQRHLLYLRALSALRNPAIVIHKGRISRQRIEVIKEGGREWWDTWREKGTDVALASRVLELAQQDVLDDAVIVSADADYVPLAATFGRMHPGKTLRFALPFLRDCRELRRVATESFGLSPHAYASCQLPESVRLPSGKLVHRPKEWGGIPDGQGSG